MTCIINKYVIFIYDIENYYLYLSQEPSVLTQPQQVCHPIWQQDRICKISSVNFLLSERKTCILSPILLWPMLGEISKEDIINAVDKPVSKFIESEQKLVK